VIADKLLLEESFLILNNPELVDIAISNIECGPGSQFSSMLAAFGCAFVSVCLFDSLLDVSELGIIEIALE
jgi:hypothetical protein